MFGIQLINEMESLQREMDQLFSGRGFAPVDASRAYRTGFKVQDAGEKFVVEAPLPGLDIEKLDINILGRQLTVSGAFVQPELPEDIRWHRQERKNGSFSQKLHLPANLETEKIEAEYKNGILKIDLPKAASALPKKISVAAG